MPAKAKHLRLVKPSVKRPVAQARALQGHLALIDQTPTPSDPPPRLDRPGALRTRRGVWKYLGPKNLLKICFTVTVRSSANTVTR